jgi:hypothetical protein
MRDKRGDILPFCVAAIGGEGIILKTNYELSAM